MKSQLTFSVIINYLRLFETLRFLQFISIVHFCIDFSLNDFDTSFSFLRQSLSLGKDDVGEISPRRDSREGWSLRGRGQDGRRRSVHLLLIQVGGISIQMLTMFDCIVPCKHIIMERKMKKSYQNICRLLAVAADRL